MSRISKKVIVLCGDGFNCEAELKRAFEYHAGDVSLVHISDFLKRPSLMLQASVLGIPGGFSFGDELRSGKILAEKIRKDFLALLPEFLAQKSLIIGVCNGFQVLMQLGVFENSQDKNQSRRITLATNDHGEFRDRWVRCQVTEAGKKSPWLKGISSGPLFMPIRHKEGNIVANSSKTFDESSLALVYCEDVNGSTNKAAGLIDQTGQIFGLMPHPEAALEVFLHPVKMSGRPNLEMNAELNVIQLKKIFENALDYK
ncbi:MAG: phosphoribosylformylglycinamidine synthase subunit PurQ [Bacteriovoracaceae bacterium]|nr:phosphoribosylformylglycinamidine synthase subunit PurQ [Bacteriovoracaceae bacterium]